MKAICQPLWKEVAWNGISFQAPIDWEIGKIGAHYLVLEDEFGPVLELKWRRIKGKFVLQDQLRRLSAVHKNKLGKTIKQIPITSGWKHVIDPFDSLSFSWQGETIGGIGLILYCSKCRTSTLLQFFQQKTRIPKKIVTQLLASFRDHRQDGQTAWAVFDITAKIPGEFRLTRYRFDAGAFELEFARRRNKITLYRRGPASILLREQDLLQYASKMFGVSQTDLQYKRVDGRNIVNSKIIPPSSGWAWTRHVLRSHPKYCRSRMWHLEDKNRLLGVKMNGGQPVDFALFEQICCFYDSV